MNPDCLAGRHAKCDGRNWDFWTDRYVPCTCPCHGKD